MVNLVMVQRNHLMVPIAKMAGLRERAVAVDEVAAGTVVNLWLPKEKQTRRPAVVLVHGFAGDGIMTWGFQLRALCRSGNDVYVPDLIHFGSSTSPSPDRSVAFQARCIAAALRKVGAQGCTVVGFSYGGFVAFQMADAHPDLVRNVVVSGAALAYTDAMHDALRGRLGIRSLIDLLLPESVRGLSFIFSATMHRKLWVPDFLLRDFLKLTYSNRKEKTEMLEAMMASGEKSQIPILQQEILLLWGEEDKLVPIEDAKRLKEDLGEKVTLQIISKAGHLAHVERPRVYSRCLRKFLAQVNTTPS